jgi:hypothetical protein
VFLGAIYYDASATVKFMDMRGVTKDLLMELFKIKKQFRTKYEAKSFIVALAQLITTSDVPDSLKECSTVGRFIKECLEMLKKVMKREQDLAAKKSRIRPNENSDDSDYGDEYSSEFDSEGSDDENDGDIQPPSGLNEEQKMDADTNQNEDQFEEDEDDFDANYDQTFELRYQIDLLKTPMQKMDEFSMFSQSIHVMSRTRPDVLEVLRNLSKEENE